MLVKILMRLVFFSFLMAACLFLPAGRADWLGAWLLVAVVTVLMVATSVLLSYRDPDLVADRARGFQGGRAWDKVLGYVMGLLGPVAIWITAGTEARFHWPGRLPQGAVLAGWALAAAGFATAMWAMLSNRFFSAVIRIQPERGHVVETGGPYRLVRHPGYAGSIAFTMSLPLVLNSLWAFVPALVTVAAIGIRTWLEDRILQRELDGYAAYARRVKYRLAPWLW